jgi:2-polyprenyl-3-methyl-5-hydroxy-6-metoxy-1,4-benzoquinol methylase
MENIKPREPQYQRLLDLSELSGNEPMGIMSGDSWIDDPKRLLFLLSRYKFASKMLQGRENVLEVGCSDAFATRIVSQHVKRITAIDFDHIFINDALKRKSERWKIDLRVHDIINDGPVSGDFDGAFALDVLEHIDPQKEDKFIQNICNSLMEESVLIIGMPSLESQEHASPLSKQGHVNCKKSEDLRQFLTKYFHHVFMFGMNDETLHTGFPAMSHYIFGVCTSKRTTPTK